MRRLVVFGATGMLGGEVVRVALDKGLIVVPVSRTGPIKFEAGIDSLSDFCAEHAIGAEDWLVNCIGWIPQKSIGDLSSDQRAANLANTELIVEIGAARRSFGFNWIQIETDCVFSGTSAPYFEDSKKDAIDLYGLSKIDGERHASGAIAIRCSIVGPDSGSNSGLFSWFLSQVKQNRSVTGYSNQLWNGVTTTAFAKLCSGIVAAGHKASIRQHWVPENVVSKLDLLKCFATGLGLDPQIVKPGLSPEAKNMTLATNNKSQNLALWNLAGYQEPPKVESMCQEFIKEHFPMGVKG